jgi:hypothetical protein
MTLNLIIPHFSLTHVFGVCGMNNRSVIEMMNERRCHYYVFGHFFKAAIAWKPYGYYIERFSGTYIVDAS